MPNRSSYISAPASAVQLSMFSQDEGTDPVDNAIYYHDKCGRMAIVDPSQPAIDPRYAIGRCTHCSDPKKIVKQARSADILIREDFFDREKWLVEREKAEMRKLVHDFADAHGRTMSPKSMFRMVELIDRHGMDGMVITDAMRRIAASHDPTERKSKRARGA